MGVRDGGDNAQAWKITGDDGDYLEFERQVPAGNLAEAKIIVLFQRRAAKQLDPDEVVSSSLRKKVTEYLTHLENGKNIGVFHTIGSSGHHYTARI